MKISNQEVYDDWKSKNTEPYGAAALRFAERWADLVEEELEENPAANFGEVAERTSREADDEGITGFMYGAAVRFLSTCWEYGDALRVWHNDQFGVTENQAKGGTVNPAILTTGGDGD
jgi:hypothetical protein